MIRGLCVLLAATMVVPTNIGRADSVTFESEVVGIPPSDFEYWGTGEAGPGRWAVVRDSAAPYGNALEQFGAAAIRSRYPLAIYKPFSGDNVDVQILFRTIAGKIERAGGVALRLTTPDDYYVARASALEDNVSFYRVVKGKQEFLAGADQRVAPNEWHTLGVRAQGDRFAISFDGKQLFGVNDATFRAAGKIALWTQADSVTRFQNIDVSALPKSEQH
jgi:hypothetical protein